MEFNNRYYTLLFEMRAEIITTDRKIAKELLFELFYSRYMMRRFRFNTRQTHYSFGMQYMILGMLTKHPADPLRTPLRVWILAILKGSRRCSICGRQDAKR
jgi:hypothetical protein